MVNCLFLFLAFSAQSKVLFHSDFECGETHLLHQVKAGQKRIKLIPNDNLSQWPAEGGTGIIEGNLAVACEVFQYGQRKGSTLLGVEGLQNSHPKYADIRTGNLMEWDEIRSPTMPPKSITVSRKSALSGNHSCMFSGTGKPSYLLGKLARLSSEYHCRMRVRFSKTALASPAFSRQIAFLISGRYSLQRLAAFHPGSKQGVYFGLLPMKNMEVLREDTFSVRTGIEADKIYCVEYSFAMEGENAARVWVKVDGRLEARQYARYTPMSSNTSCYLQLGKLDEPDMPGEFTVDEILVTDFPAGPLLEVPEVHFRNGILLLGGSETSSQGCAQKSVQWNIHDVNGWVHPALNVLRSGPGSCRFRIPFLLDLSDTVNDAAVLGNPVRIPTGISAGSPYYGRARVKSTLGEWSEWSSPVRFTAEGPGADTMRATPALARVKKAFLAEVGKKRPVDFADRNRWYDLYVYPAFAQGWKGPQYVDVYLCGTPEGCVGDHWNRGGPYCSNNNYIMSYSLDTDRIYAKQEEGSDWVTDISGAAGIYADGSPGACEQNPNRGWIRLRVRFPAEAKAGPWLLRACAGGKRGVPSPFFESLLLVRSRRLPDYTIGNGTRLAVVAALLAAVSGCAAFFSWGKRQRAKRASAPAMGTEALSGHVPSAQRANIAKAREFIQNNCERNISAKDVAQEIGVSRKWLTYFFSKGTGVTVSHYIHQVKIARAKELLKETERPVTDIAFQLGFNSQTHFWRIFSSLEGTSPKEFREKSRNST